MHDLKSHAIGIYGLTELLHKHYKDTLYERGKRYCAQCGGRVGDGPGSVRPQLDYNKTTLLPIVEPDSQSRLLQSNVGGYAENGDICLMIT